MVHSSARILGDVVRHLTADLRTVSRQIGSMLERLNKYEFWRWSIILGEYSSVYLIYIIDTSRQITRSDLISKLENYIFLIEEKANDSSK